MLFNGTVQSCADMLFDRTMNTYVCMLVRLDKYAYGGVLFGDEMSTARTLEQGPKWGIFFWGILCAPALVMPGSATFGESESVRVRPT